MKKYALITGASGGIGKAVALKLAGLGYNLYLQYNNSHDTVMGLIESLSKFGGEYIPIQADFSVKDGYKSIQPAIFALDDIIICAGTASYGMLQDLTDEEAESLFRIHIISPMLLIRNLLPKLLSNKSGSIVVVSSIWGQTGAACEAAYSAAKGAQISFVKALSKEVALSGIRVNTIAPGAIDTGMMSSFTLEERTLINEEIPAGRLGLPIEVANSIAYLLSNESSYITGQVLAVNGGWYT